MQFCVTSKDCVTSNDFCIFLLDLKSTFNDGKSHLLFFKANFLINLAFNFCYHQIQNLISLDRDMILTSGFGSAKETGVFISILKNLQHVSDFTNLIFVVNSLFHLITGYMKIYNTMKKLVL